MARDPASGGVRVAVLRSLPVGVEAGKRVVGGYLGAGRWESSFLEGPMRGRCIGVDARRPELPPAMCVPLPLRRRPLSLSALAGSRPMVQAGRRDMSWHGSPVRDWLLLVQLWVCSGHAKMGVCGWLGSRLLVVVSVKIRGSGGWDFGLPAGGSVLETVDLASLELFLRDGRRQSLGNVSSGSVRLAESVGVGAPTVVALTPTCD